MHKLHVECKSQARHEPSQDSDRKVGNLLLNQLQSALLPVYHRANEFHYSLQIHEILRAQLDGTAYCG